jgi:hypothetical protein
VDSTDLRIESAAMWSRGIHRLVLAALLGCAPSSSAAELTILRDAQDRITRMEWSTGGSRRSIMLYVVEAEPGGDVRDAPARLLWEADLGGAIVRAQGVPVAQAAAVLRDPATGVPQPTQPMDGPRPSEEVLAAAVASRSISAFFLSFQCTAIAFPDPDPLLANQCAALWLSGGAPHHLLLAPTRSTAYLAVPEARTPLDEALLGCGSLYGTSCSEDGIDLWWAHAGVLHQRFPGFAQPLPPDGDSEVLQSVAWNWFTGHALATGVEPGTGDAAACRFDAPDGCPDLAIEPRYYPARRVLEDEPTNGPQLRWDWELGTTFQLGPVSIEGDPSRVPPLFQMGLLRVHVSGPFEASDAAPAVVTYWIPEANSDLAGIAAIGALCAAARLPRRRH